MPESSHWTAPGSTRTLTLTTAPGSSCRLEVDGVETTGPDDQNVPHTVADARGVVRIYVDIDANFTESEFRVLCTPPDGTPDVVIPVHLQAAGTDTDPLHLLPKVGVERELSRDLDALRSHCDFDPFGANADQLEERGYPPRPDPALEPERFASWSSLASQPGAPQLIDPVPTRAFDRHHSYRDQPYRPGVHPISIAELGTWRGSSNWCGVGYTAAKGTIGEVIGIWRPPNIDSDVTGSTEVAHWVGIDGYGEPDVIQAGVNSTCIGVPGLHLSSHAAWWEWFPDQAHMLDMAVGPGDMFYARVSVDRAAGVADFWLINSGRATSQRVTGVKRPANVPAGALDQAEWIVERPGHKAAPPNNYRLDPLPNFSPIHFETMMAFDTVNSKAFGDDTPHVQIVLTEANRTLAYPNVDYPGSSTVTLLRQGNTVYT